MRRLKSWWLPLALILLIQWINGSGLLEGGVPVPPLKGELADGRAYGGAAEEKGPFLVYFWGSWCWVCKSMENSIGRIAKDHRVLTVALRSGDAATVSGYLADRGLTYDALVDASGRLAEAFQVQGVPALFFVDGNGRIQSATRGYTSELGIRFRLWRMAGFQ